MRSHTTIIVNGLYNDNYRGITSSANEAVLFGSDSNPDTTDNFATGFTDAPDQLAILPKDIKLIYQIKLANHSH